MRYGLLALSFAMLASGGCKEAPKYGFSCKTPLQGWRTPGDGWHNIDRNEVSIAADGQLAWNGVGVSRKTLRGYLAEIPSLDPYPVTVLHVASNADCRAVRIVRKDMDDILSCLESQMCGEGEGGWDIGPLVLDQNSVEERERERQADMAVDQHNNGGQQ